MRHLASHVFACSSAATLPQGLTASDCLLFTLQ